MLTCSVHILEIFYLKQRLLCFLLLTPGNIQEDNNTFFLLCFYQGNVPSSIDAFVCIYLQQQLMLTSVTVYFIGNGFFFCQC